MAVRPGVSFEARMWGHMSTADLPGSSLLAGRYRLVERLGAGGMSVVWRGFDEVLGRQVAVKVLPPSTSADPAFRRRLRAEAQAAARLSHRNITNVYDYGEATTVDGEPVPYVVMELIDGESLAAVLARVRRLPWQHAVRITAEVAAALAAAHARGIVHRDVTPANVMLTPSGVKVVDFGISALIGENDIDPDGSLLGTPAYLAPERLEGGQVSPATDVYAVGLLIYRTLIGQLPWDVGTTTALLRAHQYTEPEPLPTVEGLPPAVAALVGRCLEKRPEDRPSSADLAHVLAGVSAGAPVVPRGYVPDWSESGEDTTILPSQRSYPDIRAGAPVVAAAAVPPARRPVAQDAAAPAPAPAGPDEGAEKDENAEAPPVAPVRNSRFAQLKSRAMFGVVAAAAGGPQLRPALDNQAAGASAAPVGGGAGTAARAKTRRVLVVAGAVVVLGLGTYAWSLTSEPPADNPANAALPQPSVVPATGKCVVSYAVWSDAGGRFKAQVTLANRNETAVKNWKLWFILPGDQVISGNGKVNLTQVNRAVTLSSAAALNPQRALTLPISGRYALNNTAPLAFSLNGRTCETFVSSKPGEPSRRVEHLSNGQVRLGPTPSENTPVPGISIDPTGIVHITPTTAPTVAPTAGATTTPTTKATTTTAPLPSATTTATTDNPPPPAPSESTPTTEPTTPPVIESTTVTTTPPTPSLEACDPADPTCI